MLGVESCTSSLPDKLKPHNVASRSATINEKHFYRYTAKVLGYAIELLILGLLYTKFTDAIREGDGLCIQRCWRFMFPLFRVQGEQTTLLSSKI